MSVSTSSLRRLSDIISDAVTKIEDKCATTGLTFPSLEEPFNPMNPNEALTVDPDISQNAMLVIAAAHQLAATVRLPAVSVIDLSLGFHFSSSLKTVMQGNVVEILREGGPQGVHATEIAAKNGMDAEKVSRLLRLLATHHVFREVRPDVWTNNRLSSMLDTLKSSSELFAHPEERHVDTPGLAALLEHGTDEVFKGSLALADVLTDPNTARSESPTDSAWNRAFCSNLRFFDWLEVPGNEARHIRFNVAMAGVSKLDDGKAILRGFPWESLPKGGKVVDVGGGIGSVSLTVANQFPTLKFIIQELPTVAKQGEKFIDENMPDARQSERIVFRTHDFFSPQPVHDADLFMLRMVAHDWPSGYVVKILKQLRAVALPGKTKLLLVEQVVPYACTDTTKAAAIPGAVLPPVPQPLLANLGKANSSMYLGDLQMLTIQQGQDRSLGGYVRVTQEAGWNIVQLYTPSGSITRHIVAEAV